jgi:hypothetical protein
MFFEHIKVSRVVLIIGVLSVFARIYQHNSVIKLNYQNQRLEKQKSQLEKDRNELLMELYELHDPETVLTQVEQWGMAPLKVSQVMTLTTQARIDFIGTTSQEDVLQKIGIDDFVTTHSGGNHVSS